MSLYYSDEIREAMLKEGLDMAKAADCKEYAGLLERKEIGIPSCLWGVGHHPNKKCEWDKVKAFINFHKHGVNFEMVGRLFQDPIPNECEIIYEEYDEHSTEQYRRDGNFDSRDRLVAQIVPNHYIVVKLDPQHTVSGKVHIVTAYYADRTTVLDAIKKRSESGSDALFQALVRVDDFTYDYFGHLPTYSGDMTKFALIYSHWHNNNYTVLELVDALMKVDSSMSVEQADGVAYGWLFKKNIDVMTEIAKRL